MVSANGREGYRSSDSIKKHGENGAGWRSVTPREPCPICGQDGWCCRAEDGAIICNRAERDGLSTAGWRAIKRQAGTDKCGLMLIRDDGLSTDVVFDRKPREKKAKTPKVSPAIWKQRAAAYQNHMGDQRAVLASILGVDESALAALQCGWRPERGDWTFPERNAAGEIVGVSTRLAVPITGSDGKVTSKMMVPGSSHGLFYAPDAWAAGDGPILLVEGASDTAAAYTMGLAAVGRPSNTGGVEYLAELLRDVPASRPIIVVGENDERDGKIPGQKICPGRNGAILTAKRLAEEMGREIAWAMPPAEAKDTRDYLRQAGRQAGPRFVDAILAGATSITPDEIDGIERMPDRGAARDLEEWRRESREKKIAALSKPGFYLDRGDVGTGKTKSMIDAIKETGQTSILWIMPDHANCQEREDELRKIGVHAVAYPRLDETNCENIADVKEAQKFGLVAGAAVCPGCPFNTKCRQSGYLAQLQRADESPLRISTISRAQASSKIFRGKTFKDEAGNVTGERPAASVIVADERAGDLLGETIKTTMPDLKLAKHFLANVEAGQRLAGGQRVGRKNEGFARGLLAVIDVIEKASESVKRTALSAAKDADKNVAAGGVNRVELPPKIEMPKEWQAAFNEWVQTFKTHLDGERLGEDFAAGIRLITLAAAGRLHELWVMGERKIVTVNGKRIATTQVEVMGKRLADVPKRSRVFMLDADATAEDLAARTGRRIVDITPAGHIPVVQKVRQVPLDVTKSQSASTTAKIIEAHLWASPAVRRLGVIGHKGAIDQIFEDDSDLLNRWSRARVAMTAGYGTGQDRGSNLWAVECDDLAVIGTPRAPIVRAWLVAHGKIEAACLPDGDWGEIAWEGMTTDGRRKVFKARGYRNPEWRQASKSIHLAAIRQAGGRARAILPTGISVTLYTDQPTGFPVDESIEAALPSVHEAVDAVVRVIESRRRAGKDGEDQKAQNGLDTLLDDFALFPVRSTDVVTHLEFAGNIGRRAAQEKIRLAVSAGRLERVGNCMIRLAQPTSRLAAVEASGGPSAASATAEPLSTPPLVAAAPTLPAVIVRAAQPEPADEPVIVAASVVPATSTQVDAASTPANGSLISRLKIALAGLPPPRGWPPAAASPPRVPTWPEKPKDEPLCEARMLLTKTA